MSKKNQQKMAPREKEAKEFDEEVLQIDRVTRVVKGGRRLRFRCLVAIGDRKGRVGIGIGKATEVVNGIKKAIAKAKNSLIKVVVTEHDSIPHAVQVKYKPAKMFIMPAAPGTGVIAGGALRKILSLAGIKNVLSKNHGSTNKVITAQAAMIALTQLRPLRRFTKKADVADKNEHLAAEDHNKKHNSTKDNAEKAEVSKK